VRRIAENRTVAREGASQEAKASTPPAAAAPGRQFQRVRKTPSLGESYEPLPLFKRECWPATASVIQRLHSGQLSV
jgi:hypothetical protein